MNKGTWVKVKEGSRYYEERRPIGFIVKSHKYSDYTTDHEVMFKYEPPLKDYETFSHINLTWGTVAWIPEKDLIEVEPLQNSFTMNDVLDFCN